MQYADGYSVIKSSQSTIKTGTWRAVIDTGIGDGRKEVDERGAESASRLADLTSPKGIRGKACTTRLLMAHGKMVSRPASQHADTVPETCALYADPLYQALRPIGPL